MGKTYGFENWPEENAEEPATTTDPTENPAPENNDAGAGPFVFGFLRDDNPADGAGDAERTPNPETVSKDLNVSRLGVITGGLNSLERQTGAAKGKKVKLMSYVDSGAARSVCPKQFGQSFGITVTDAAKRGDGFQTATGKKVKSQGARKVFGRTAAGKPISMNYVVADVAVALDSVSQICDTGASVHFTRDGGWVQSPDGSITNFERIGDSYLRSVWIDADTAEAVQAPFSRQEKSAP